jgi:hypothetical protein
LLYKGILAQRRPVLQGKPLRTVILPNGEYKNYGLPGPEMNDWLHRAFA